MADSYARTRDRLEQYFDRTAAEAWERLTSEAPVSRIRRTVREGRERMRALLLARLPADLGGARVLDAGCGTGQASLALAARGADVVAVDISPRLVATARDRTPAALSGRLTFRAGDMLDPALGRFDYVLAMDSLIHYPPAQTAHALRALAARTDAAVLFTVAPFTPLLALMHAAGRLFPRGDRSPAVVPVRPAALARALGGAPTDLGRVARGFYISQAMELRP
jgi:magnesium-protoporphyrin O-methyltransferase